MGCGSSVHAASKEVLQPAGTPIVAVQTVDEIERPRYGRESEMEFEVHSNQRRGEEVQEESAWKLSPDQTQKLSAFFTRSTALTSEIVDDLRVFHEECQEIPMQLGLSSDVFIEKRRSSPTFEQFCQSLCREWEIRCKQHFLEKLSQASIIRSIAEGIPAGSPDNPLLFVQCTTMKDIAKWCQGTLVSKLTASFSSIKGLLEGEDEASSLLQRSSEAVNGKFCVAEFGKLEEFHKGLLERVGYPSLNFYEGMRQEHSEREDSEERFTTPNYLLETSPAQEWRVVTEEEERVQACQGRRRVRSVEELMSEEIVVRAKLRKEEILALILYTGPMYLKYNAVLRGFPGETVEGLRGNKYPTTLFCIVSGIIKLSNFMRLPRSRLLYRGLGGVGLPQAFLHEDEFLITGGVEYGMMSVTLNKEVAIQYLRGHAPTLFEISCGAVDRGASLRFLSQYPGEDEILYPPLSYLEVVGKPRVELVRYALEDGKNVQLLVRVVPTKISMNLKCSTIEDMISRRKNVYVAVMRNVEEDVRKMLHAKGRDALRGDPSLDEVKVETLRRQTQQDCEEVVELYLRREEAWFNSEKNYASAMQLAVYLAALCVDKFEHCARARDWGNQESLIVVGRHIIALLNAQAADSETTAEEKAKLSDQIFERSRMLEAIGDVMDTRESPLAAAAASGDIQGMERLLAAGKLVDAVDKNGRTALQAASLMGYDKCVKLLLLHRADADVRDEAGETAVHLACSRGHVEVLHLLIEGKSLHEAVVAQRRDGRTALDLAAENAHSAILADVFYTAADQQDDELLQLVLRVGGACLASAADGEGRTCAHWAVRRGRVDVLRALLEQGGAAAAQAADCEGTTCAHLASGRGDEEALVALLGVGGNAIIHALDRFGRTPAHHAVVHEKFDALRLLLERGGREVAVAADRKGLTCALIAAEWGEVQALEMLIEAGGQEVVKASDAEGRTCAHWAAWRGNVEILARIIELAGPQVVLATDSEGKTCAHWAGDRGEFGTFDILLAAGGKQLATAADHKGKTCAHWAVQKGSVEALRKLIEVGGKEVATAVDKEGKTCAYWSVWMEDEASMEVLLAAAGKEAVMSADEEGKTCAHLAAERGATGMLRKLLAAGGKELATAADKWGCTCAHWAAWRGEAEALGVVLEAGGEEAARAADQEGKTCSYFACRKNDARILDMIIQVGGTDLVKDLRRSDSEGHTCAHWAAWHGNVEILARIIELAGPQVVLATDSEGKTCAHWAGDRGEFGTFDILLAAGGKQLATAADHKGKTCAHWAVQKGSVEALRKLIEVGGKEVATAVDKEGKTCAHFAAEQRDEASMEVLLAAAGKEAVMSADEEGKTCAHLAAERGATGMLRKLLAAGGKELATAADKWGCTCAHWAAWRGEAEALGVVLEAGGEEAARAADQEGKTCAHFASEKGDLELVKMAIRTGGTDLVTVPDKEGHTCISIADKLEKEEVVQYLRACLAGTSMT